MAQVEQQGPPASGGDFRDALNDLRHQAGNPPLREIADRAGCSHTTVAAILNGPALPPRFILAEGVVKALGGDIEQFRALWYRATGGTPEPAEPARPAEQQPAFSVGGDYVRGDKSGGDTIVRGNKYVYDNRSQQ